MASRLDTLDTSMSMQSLHSKEEIEEGEGVRVYIRVRPATEREVSVASPKAVTVEGSSVLLKSDPPRSFTFDGVLGESATQQEVFETVGRSVGSSCLAGYNGSVYVYGQTGAGKTHTMCGPVGSVQSMQFDERRGIICRMLDYVFSEIARRGKEENGTEHSCRCSFLEIYKEQITDLLEPQNTNLQVREDLQRGVYVERLSELACGNLTEAFQALWRGLQQRQVGSTHMNEQSSRSHAVFTLYVEAARSRAGVTSTRAASLNLVDLAGSERQQHAGDPRAQTYESLRVKEAAAVNKSLMALTNVIMSLSREERSKRRRRGSNYVHYRDSKLTFLLRDSLGGNSKTVVVANVSPAQICCAETVSTLKFAARAKHIRCSVVRNEAFSGTVESLMEEVKLLRKELVQLSGRSFERAKGLSLDSSKAVLEEPEAEDREEEAPHLSSQQRVTRLEVLLAAALEREQQAEQKGHRLQRLSGFLEDLDFRKCHGVRKLHKEYWEQLVPQVEASSITDDPEVQELSSKLKSFGYLLGNLAQGARLEDGDYEPEAANSTTVDESFSPETGTEAISGDEAAFIREENQLLRRQLECHPEVQRLATENWALREELRALDPAGWPAIPGQPKMASDLRDTQVLSPPAISSEVVLRNPDNDDSASKTWFHFQKMAKEVEELMRAKEGLSRALELTSAAEAETRQVSLPKATSRVTVSMVRDLDIATQEALKQAQGLAAASRLAPTGRRGAKEVDGGSAAGDGSPEVFLRARDDKERLNQALQRVKQLQGTVDLLSAAYGDAFGEFQRLREEYESRLEECQFFELQCSRLNLMCMDLADRLAPGQRPRGGGFSTTGLPKPSEKQKRSFSMSSLRDATFWESRFQELRELTGADARVEAAAPPFRVQSPPLGTAHAGLGSRLAQSSSLSALQMRPSPQPGFGGELLRRVYSAPVLEVRMTWPGGGFVPVMPHPPLPSPTPSPVPSPVPMPPMAPMPMAPMRALPATPPPAPAMALPQGRSASVGRQVLTLPRRLGDTTGPLSHRASYPRRMAPTLARPAPGVGVGVPGAGPAPGVHMAPVRTDARDARGRM